MDKQREEGYQARYLLSCCGIMVLDGDGNVIGHLLYNVDKDCTLPIKCEEKNNQRLCKLWKESKEPLKYRKYLCISEGSSEGHRFQMCVIKDCACNTPIVRKIPKDWIKIRYGLNWIRFQEFFAQFDAPMPYEDDDEAPPGPAKKVANLVDDPGLEWKRGWSCTNFALASKLFKLLLHREVTPGPEMSGHEGTVMARSCLEMLPLEVYEVLVEDLDGLSLLNMCNSSPKIEKRILEPFLYYQPHKGMAKWFEYCARDLHRPVMIKILSSFDTSVRPLKKKAEEDVISPTTPTWEMIFKCYQHYWSTLLGSNVRVQNFTKFETQLKGEMLITSQSYDSAQFYRKTFSGGGRMLCNILFPSISEYDTTNMVVIEDYEQVDCRNSGTLCETSTLPKLFVVKLAYLPNVSSNAESPFSPPPVSKVLVSACYKCVTTIPLQGGTGRTLDLQLEGVTEEDLARQRKPIIEIHSNIIALWLAPEHLLFLALNQTEVDGQIAYGIVLLYRLQVPQMTLLWDRLEELREDYLPIIREYKGRTVLLNANVERELRDFNRAGPLPMGQAEPTYYGLALVSPLYGIECLRPKEDLDVGAWESLDPQYYPANARPHLSSFREWSCSGKGFGLFVFCNDKSLAVSWNGLNWIFGSVKLLLSTIAKTDNKRSVAYVEVIYDNGLLLVVNDTIILLELALITKKPKIVEGVNVAEPELRINPLRAFPLGLSSMEISQFELNFDMGKPFFFIICEKKPILVKDKDGSNWRSDDYGFRMKRVDFLCD